MNLGSRKITQLEVCTYMAHAVSHLLAPSNSWFTIVLSSPRNCDNSESFSTTTRLKSTYLFSPSAQLPHMGLSFSLEKNRKKELNSNSYVIAGSFFFFFFKQSEFQLVKGFYYVNQIES